MTEPRRHDAAASRYAGGTLAAVALAALLAAGAGFLPGVAGAQDDDWNGFDVSRRLVPPGSILRGGPPADGIPSIDKPVFDEASQVALDPDEPVVGLAIGDAAKAYPLRILAWHEVVNDELGGRPVAVTWCPLAASALVFDRRRDGGVLEFGVSGLLHESNLLMFDRRTSSLWSQLGAGAIAGPLSGAKLEAVPAAVVPWKRWREEHPATLVLSRRTGHDRDYGRDPYGDDASSDATLFPVSRRDPRLPVKEPVLGVVVDGEALAFPLSRLPRGAAPLALRAGTHRLEVDADRGEVRVDGRAAAAVRAWWFAWAAFHPGSALWDGEALSRPGGGGAGAAAVARPAADVRVSGVSGYWTSMGSLFVGTPQASMDTATMLEDPDRRRDAIFVLRGDLENVSVAPIHDVVLSFELLDEQGLPVVRLEGLNHLAEPLLDAADGAAHAPIAPGGRDTFRMLFFGDETPRFRGHRVGVVAVH